MPDVFLIVVSVLAAIVLGITVILAPLAVLTLRVIVRDLDDLKLSVNGKMEKLLHAFGASQRAEGIEQERTEEYARQREKEGRST